MNSSGYADDEKIDIPPYFAGNPASCAIDPPVDNEFLLSHCPIDPEEGIVVRAERPLAGADEHVRTGLEIASGAKDIQAARIPGDPSAREIDFSMSYRKPI
jgi:hypothetical protein